MIKWWSRGDLNPRLTLVQYWFPQGLVEHIESEILSKPTIVPLKPEVLWLQIFCLVN